MLCYWLNPFEQLFSCGCSQQDVLTYPSGVWIEIARMHFLLIVERVVVNYIQLYRIWKWTVVASWRKTIGNGFYLLVVKRNNNCQGIQSFFNSSNQAYLFFCSYVKKKGWNRTDHSVPGFMRVVLYIVHIVTKSAWDRQFLSSTVKKYSCFRLSHICFVLKYTGKDSRSYF